MTTENKAKKSEKIRVELTRYFDNDGNPTCARNFEAGEYCIFFRTIGYGLRETCVFMDKGTIYRRGSRGLGTLIPCKECIVHNTPYDIKINGMSY